MTNQSPIMSLRDIRKSYGSIEVLHGIDLDIYPGEVVALIKQGQNSNAIPKTDAHFGSILESQTPRATADAGRLPVSTSCSTTPSE